MEVTSGAWRHVIASAPPTPALGKHVVDHLRRLIITRELPAGTHLVEVQLSETFEVSRGPIRDALRQLEAEGLVGSRRRGVFVIGLSPDDIEELYMLRRLIEVQAVTLCIEGGSRTYDAAHAAVERMSRAADRQDSAEFANADLDFHSAFYAGTGRRRLDAIWQQYRPTFADVLAVTNAEDRDLGPTFQDHLDLLAAIENGDLDGAIRLLTAHLDGSQRRMLAAYSRFVDTADTA